MAFLTYRQSDQTTTDAQKQQKNVILGVPLTMYHVDANFKAINDQLVAYNEKYGLAIGPDDTQLSITQVFGSNDVNAVKNTGFYKIATAANRPSSVTNSVLIHAQSADGDVDDITAIQLTAGVNNTGEQVLYYRTKQGQNTWNSWEAFANNNTVDLTIDQLQQKIDQCIKRTGDTITGQLILENKLQLTGSNDIIANSVVKGTVPSSNTSDGFNIYDSTGVVNESTKLGFFGLKQNVNSFSGLSLSAVNPTASGSSQTTEILVGWKQNENGTYVPYTYAPTPSLNDPNQIATTGWVDNKIEQLVIDQGIFTDEGGTITGDVSIEGDLSVVTGNSEFNAAVFYDLTKFHAPSSYIIPYEKGEYPSSLVGSSGTGIRFVDETEEIDLFHTGGQVWGAVDYQGKFTTEISSYNWLATTDENKVVMGTISVSVAANGTITTYAPNPPANDNSNQIATTSWTKRKVENVVNNAITEYANEHPWDLGVL